MISIVQTNEANSVKFNLVRLCAGWHFFCAAVMEEVRGLAQFRGNVVYRHRLTLIELCHRILSELRELSLNI